MTISTHTISARIGNYYPEVKSGTITLDEGWAPYIQATLVCADDGPDGVAGIDPRDDLRGLLTLTESFGPDRPEPVLSFYTAAYNGDTIDTVTATGPTLASLTARLGYPWLTPPSPAVTRTFDLGLRARRRGALAGTVELEFASDEALLQDKRRVSTTALEFGSLDIRPIVDTALLQIGPRALAPGTTTGTTTDEARFWQPGDTLWDYVAPLCEQAGLRFWCDEDRIWHLDSRDDFTVPSGIVLSGTETVVDSDDVIDLDSSEWADSVVVIYRWETADGTPRTRIDFAALSDNPIKTFSITRDTPWPGAGAAQRMLDRMATKSRSVSVTAVSDYRANPGMRATITDLDQPALNARISSVAWTFPDSQMLVATRDAIETT